MSLTWEEFCDKAEQNSGEAKQELANELYVKKFNLDIISSVFVAMKRELNEHFSYYLGNLDRFIDRVVPEIVRRLVFDRYSEMFNPIEGCMYDYDMWELEDDIKEILDRGEIKLDYSRIADKFLDAMKETLYYVIRDALRADCSVLQQIAKEREEELEQQAIKNGRKHSTYEPEDDESDDGE